MLHESVRVPSNVHPAQTATMTGDSVQMGPLETQTSQSAPAVPPPRDYALSPNSSASGPNPVIIKDPVTGQQTLVSKTMGLSLGTGLRHLMDPSPMPFEGSNRRHGRRMVEEVLVTGIHKTAMTVLLGT